MIDLVGMLRHVQVISTSGNVVFQIELHYSPLGQLCGVVGHMIK